MPKLKVGIQRALSIWLHDGSSVPSNPEDEERLTCEETTTTVHYLFRFAPEQIDAFASGPARVVFDHPHYDAVVELSEDQRSELLRDLRD